MEFSAKFRMASIVFVGLVFVTSQVVDSQFTVGLVRQACNCTQLDTCMTNLRQQRNTITTNCRANCTASLTAANINTQQVTQCFTAYENAIQAAADQMRTCMETVVGRPCTGAAGTVQPAPAPAVNGRRRIKRQVLGTYGFFGYNALPFPPAINGFQQCVSTCQLANAYQTVTTTGTVGNIVVGKRRKRYLSYSNSNADYGQCAYTNNCILQYTQNNFNSFQSAYCTCAGTNQTQVLAQQYTTLCSCLTAAAPGQTFACNGTQYGYYDYSAYYCGTQVNVASPIVIGKK